MDFSKALEVRANTVERPPNAPKGHYRFRISKPPVFGSIESPKGNWDTVDIPATAIEPSAEDVDSDDLQKFGGAKSIRLRVKFMFDKADTDEGRAAFDRTKFRIVQFLTVHCGQPDNLTLRELLDQCQGKEFIGEVISRPDKNDADNEFAEIGRTGPVV